MNRLPLPVVIGVVVVAVAALVFSIGRTMRGNAAPPTPVGKPAVNNTVMQNLYRATHRGMPAPGTAPAASPAAPSGGQ